MKHGVPTEPPPLPTNDDDWEKLRARAEALLRERPNSLQSPGEVDLARLIQDLRVHQIELELQNEELRRAQRELEESRDAFSRLFNQAPVGYVSIDQSGRIGRFNRTFLEMTLGAEPEVADRTFADLLVEQDRPVFLARFKAFFKSPEGKTIQVRLRRPTRDALTVRLTGRSEVMAPSSENGQGGSPHLLVLVTDVSEIVESDERAREKSALFESLFMCLPFEAWVRDVQNRVLLQNQRSIEHRGPLLGKRPQDSSGVPDEVVRRWEGNNRRALAGEVVREESQDSERTIYTVVSPVRDGDRIIGTVGINIDISDRKRAESERLEMERRLLHTQKLESLGVLAGGIAHDFNNLLVAILGNLDLALDDLTSDSEARQSVEHAKKASLRARDLTRQMLAYSGRGRFVVAPISLNELVLENLRILRAAISPTVTMDLRLGSELPLIMADAAQIQQVVMNLFTNASEAIADRPGTMTVSTSLVEVGDSSAFENLQPGPLSRGRYVKLEVADTGCGMDADTQKRLFEPFFSTKFTGRGLGMSAVLGIVRGHQGGISLDSALGAGTTIRVLFPVTTGQGIVGEGQAQPRSEDPNSTSRPAVPMGEGVTGVILVVDDDEMVRDLCAAMVRKCGFRTLVAAEGQEAVRLFEVHRSEIRGIILDLMMPTMDGISAFDAFIIREPNLRIMLTSGYSEQDVLRQFQGKRVAGFLQKPYEFEAFCRAFRKVF